MTVLVVTMEMDPGGRGGGIGHTHTCKTGRERESVAFLFRGCLRNIHNARDFIDLYFEDSFIFVPMFDFCCCKKSNSTT